VFNSQLPNTARFAVGTPKDQIIAIENQLDDALTTACDHHEPRFLWGVLSKVPGELYNQFVLLNTYGCGHVTSQLSGLEGDTTPTDPNSRDYPVEIQTVVHRQDRETPVKLRPVTPT